MCVAACLFLSGISASHAAGLRDIEPESIGHPHEVPGGESDESTTTRVVWIIVSLVLFFLGHEIFTVCKTHIANGQRSHQQDDLQGEVWVGGPPRTVVFIPAMQATQWLLVTEYDAYLIKIEKADPAQGVFHGRMYCFLSGNHVGYVVADPARRNPNRRCLTLHFNRGDDGQVVVRRAE
jgi:hypothetical protein